MSQTGSFRIAGPRLPMHRLMLEGERARLAGDRSLAIHLLRCAVRLAPNNSAAWRGLAACETGARRAICLQWANTIETFRATAPRVSQTTSRRNFLRTLATAAGSVAAVSLGGTWIGLDLLYPRHILPGIAVPDLPLDGLSREAARERLAVLNRRRGDRLLLMRAAGREWGIQVKHLLVEQSREVADAAWLVGHEPSRRSRLRSRLRLLRGERVVFTPATINGQLLTRLVDQVAGSIDRPVRDARIVRDGTGWHTLAEQSGRVLDRAAATARLRTVLDRSAREPEVRVPIVVELPVTVTPPHVSAAALKPLKDQLERLRAQPFAVSAGEQSWQVDRSSLVRWGPEGVVGAGRGRQSQRPLLEPDPLEIRRRLMEWDLSVRHEALSAPRSGQPITVGHDALPSRRIAIAESVRVIAAAVMRDSTNVILPLQEPGPPPIEAELLGLDTASAVSH